MMSEFLQLAFLIAIFLLSAKAAGALSVRFGQPSVLGELLVGVLLGPSLVDILHLPFIEGEKLGATIKELGELGVLLLMFIAGLELHLEELTHNSKVSAYAGILGVFTPVVLGTASGLLFHFEWDAALFLGLTLGATSVSISAQTLMELKVLRTRVGLGLLGAAVFDDIMVIFLLSIFLAVVSGGTSVVGILLILGKMAIFLAASVGFGIYILPKLVRFTARLPVSQGALSLAVIILLFYGIAAELIGGMAAITGSFLAGLMFARCEDKERLERGVSALAYGFFVPIFFISIGLAINLREFEQQALLLTGVIIVVAILSKFLGAGLGARWAGFEWLESWQVGAGMVSRGEVGLIVANVGISMELVAPNEFSAIIGMVLATTIVTPPMLRALFATPRPRNPANPGKTEEAGSPNTQSSDPMKKKKPTSQKRSAKEE